MEPIVTRVKDLKPPHQISEDDFEAICRDFRVSAADQLMVREFLNDAVTSFSSVISKGRALPSRQDDRKAIKNAIEALRTAQNHLQRSPGSAGSSALRVAAAQVGPLVSGSWMRNRFPGDRHTPIARYWPADDHDLREPPRWAVPVRPTEIDDLSLAERVAFMRAKGGSAIAALVEDIAAGLEAGRGAILELPSGRKPLEIRKYLLAGLAELWWLLDRQPTTGMKSKYGEFCECVLDAIGWPTLGVNAALEDAIRFWRSEYNRPARD